MTLTRALPTLLCISAAFGSAAVAPPDFSKAAYFEPNRGQADSRTAFLARGPQYTALLRSNGAAVYLLSSAAPDTASAVRMELLGTTGAGDVAGGRPLGSVTHYYRGNQPAEWRIGIPHYQDVRLRGVYPGIDMAWQFQGPDLEYRFSLDGGTDPRRIQLRFHGARRVWIDRAGNLVLETRAGRLCHRKPVAWQEIAGRRLPVSACFGLHDGIAGFQLGAYDRARPLWIDPTVSYATYLGGAGYDAGYAVAAGVSGQSYVTGTTASVSFSSLSSGLRANRDAFVSKFNADGSIAYTTILSSSDGDDYGYALAVDSAGNVYVAGSTDGNDFPATAGAWQIASAGGQDAFAAKLDPNGNLVYATYIGGAGEDVATGVAVDPSGHAYIGGFTASVGFPTTPGVPQPTYAGGAYDAFLVKLNASATTAVYATLLGGSGADEAFAIALDPSGNACIAGYTDSPDLPVQSPLQASYLGDGDALVACLNTTGTAWTTVSYLGGCGRDEAYAIAIDAAANIYLAGATFSYDFPTTPGAFQAAPATGYDAFLVKLAPGASGLTYATLLGGSGTDAATALAVGSAGDVWTAGYTMSVNFPLAAAWQAIPGGGFDGFVAHLSADGTALLAASYLGGSGDDQILGLAWASTGQVFVTGSTNSTNFPVTLAAAEPTPPGGYNAFLAEIDPATASYSISGQVATSGSGPLSGVTLMLTGAASASTVTGVSGDYSFVGLSPGGSYTVTPSGLGYSFSPASQSFANLNGNQTAGFSGACLLSVSPSTVYLDSTAQPGPPIGVAASASCVWAATAGAAFLTLTSGTSGSGDGTVAFSVPANTSGADLAGSLSVGGQTVSITQRETAAVFTDVGPVDFDFDAANILFAQGITGGCSATPRMYCPNENITRGQMAVFIVTAIEGGNSFTYTTTPYFTDVPSSNPFFKFIQKLKDLGITSGCTATTYCPGDPVTRGQMAVFIITARYGAIPYSYPSTPYFTDVPASNAFFAFIQKMAQVGITAGCAPGLYCPANTLTRGQMAIFISAGLLNELLPATTPLVVQATPHAAAPGQTVTVALSGCGTHFAPGSTQVATAPGITASNIAVTGPTSLTVQFTVSSGLTPGPSSIVATTGTEEAVLPNGFAVQ